MGARLVKMAYAYAVDIPLKPNEFRLLAFMALSALDADESPRYFDSREASALALGRRVEDDSEDISEADKRERLAAFEAVKTAIRGLVAVGAIVRVKSGRSGQRAEFAIRLSPMESMRTPEYRRRSGEGKSFPARKENPSPLGREFLPSGEGKSFPQGTTQEPREQTEGTRSPNRTISLARVDEVA